MTSQTFFSSPHDEVGLVDVLPAAAVPQDAAVADHRTLLEGQLQRVVLQSAKKKDNTRFMEGWAMSP